MPPKGPYKLCTVNTAPERAKRVVGRFIEDAKESYTISHLENVESTSLTSPLSRSGKMLRL
jgi:hypothetical protein